MQSVLVFILAVMWSIYFGMWLLSRRERRSLNSIATFHKHLAVLERAAPGRTGAFRPASASGSAAGSAVRPSPAAPRVRYAPARPGMTLTEARIRRRRALTSLAATASVTAGLAFVAGGPVWGVNGLADVALAGYVLALVRARRSAAERRSKVVYLPRQVTAVAPPAEPAYLQRSAN